jgi:hypothetical protein
MPPLARCCGRVWFVRDRDGSLARPENFFYRPVSVGTGETQNRYALGTIVIDICDSKSLRDDGSRCTINTVDLSSLRERSSRGGHPVISKRQRIGSTQSALDLPIVAHFERIFTGFF